MVAGDTSGFACFCGRGGDYDPGVAWELLRFHIEERNCMIHDMTSMYRKVIQGSCFVGVPFSEYKQHQRDLTRCTPLTDTSTPGPDPIVLVRLPVVRDWRGRPQRNTYAPVDISHLERQLTHPTITTPEKLKLVGRIGSIKSNMASYRESIGVVPEHPSYAAFDKHVFKRDMRPPRVTPPDTYICGHCLAAGHHLKEHCPKMEELPNWVSVTKRKPPTGVPMNKIREARTEEEKATAPFVKDGVFFVWRRR